MNSWYKISLSWADTGLWEDSKISLNISSVSKQLSDQHLRGSRLSKISKIPIDGVKNLCGMVTIDPKRTEEIFKEILESSQRPVSAQDKDILYQEFKAYKAQQDLDKALEQN